MFSIFQKLVAIFPLQNWPCLLNPSNHTADLAIDNKGGLPICDLLASNPALLLTDHQANNCVRPQKSHFLLPLCWFCDQCVTEFNWAYMPFCAKCSHCDCLLWSPDVSELDQQRSSDKSNNALFETVYSSKGELRLLNVQQAKYRSFLKCSLCKLRGGNFFAIKKEKHALYLYQQFCFNYLNRNYWVQRWSLQKIVSLALC